MQKLLNRTIGAAILLGLLSAQGARADQLESLRTVQAGCAKFQEKLRALPNVTQGVIQVPKHWNNPSLGLVPLFWWKREGKNPAFPPLAFIHGGVAANSWAALDRLQTLLNEYPGDFIAMDHRGEGCSKTLPSNLDPSQYAYLRVRNVVRDLEYLRRKLVPGKQWRLFGQSRGSAIIHYYLEMAPEGIESAHAHGFSIMPGNGMAQYTFVRALGFYKVGEEYLRRFPMDGRLVTEIRHSIPESQCWIGLDDRKLCGPGAMDVFYNMLPSFSNWNVLHQTLQSLANSDGSPNMAEVTKKIGEQLKSDIYGHFGYIIGTNGRDFGNPDSVSTQAMRNHLFYRNVFLGELRMIGEAFEPSITYPWASSFDPIDYARVRYNLMRYPGLRYFLYSSKYDPRAPREMYAGEVTALGNLIKFVPLENSGHDGWFSEPLVTQNILKE